MRKSGWLLALLAIWIATAPLARAQEPEAFAERRARDGLRIGTAAVYAIRWDDRLIGFTRYAVESPVSVGGEQFYVINSQSRVKLGAGLENDVSFKAKLLLNTHALEPSFFFCRQFQGSNVAEVECLFTDKVIAQKTRVGKTDAKGNLVAGEETSTRTDVEKPAYLVFNNVWGRIDTFAEHYAVLLARWLNAGAREDLPIYDAVLRGTARMRFQAMGRETLKLNDKTFPARRFALIDARGQIVVKAWVAADSNQLLKLEEPGGLTFTLSDMRVEAMVDRTPGTDLYKQRIQFSNVYFPNAAALRTFDATLDVRLRGQPLLDRNIRGFSQKFNGTTTAGTVAGTVSVATSPVDVRKSDSWPNKAGYSGDLAAWTAPAPGIESASDEMKSKGLEVAWRSRNNWEAIRKINAWVYEKVKFGYAMPSARSTLENMIGNSESKAMLVVAMLRAVKIPARKISGLWFDEGNFVPHHWVEAYVGEDGWVAMDPTTGEEGTLGATHVALSEDGDLVRMGVQVNNYAPRPPARVVFFNRELAWPVGEQRTYQVLHRGKEIGKEVGQVAGLVKVDGNDAFQMEFSTDLALPEGHKVAAATLVTTPVVLPLSYKVSSGPQATPSAGDEHVYTVKGFQVQEEITVGGERKIQQTPISEGVYLADRRFLTMWAMLVGQVPNPTLGQSYQMHVYLPETHTTEEVTLTVRQEDKLGLNGEERDTWRIETGDGIAFFVDKTSGQVLRVENPRQDIVLVLVESKTKI
ncbi:MAG: transglutaminase domain-containing protein [Armatimonadetes bacterium]|nr:transglutaminase domain-containing protein [Armatimonadota bacterium]